MRHKFDSCFQFSFFENEEELLSIVREYRAEYRRISTILETLPKIIDIVHSDLKTLNKSEGGRASLFSSESLFRALLVKQKEGIDYREACIRISESEFLKDFCKFSRKVGIDYSLLCKAFKAISPDSWQVINQLLAMGSIKNETLFEPHTELIQRGRREKPVEFGHKIVLNQAKSKFITGYQVLRKESR